MKRTDSYVWVKVMQDRAQRWLANQRNASWVIETQNIKKKNNIC